MHVKGINVRNGGNSAVTGNLSERHKAFAGGFKAYAKAIKASAMLLLAVAAVLLTSVFISVRTGKTCTASAASAKKVVISHDDLSAEVVFGNGGITKFRRNVPVTVNLTNKGDDFSGVVRVRFNTSYSYNQDAMVEQSFDIAEGQTKTIQMLLLPFDRDTGNMKIELCDKDGDVLESKEMHCDYYASGIYAGVLSDDATGLLYLKSIFQRNASANEDDVFEEDEDDETYHGNQSVSAEEVLGEDINKWEGSFFELKAEDINDDAEYLDMYDLLIIDNFDTKALRPEQKKAIVSWVKNGGTLLLSTGGNPDKVLGGFLDEDGFNVSVNGGAKTVKTTFGWSREDVIQYSGSQGNTDPVEALVSSLTLEGKGKAVLKDGNDEILQRKEIGMGALMVSEFSMALPKNVWYTYGGAFLYTIGKNMGKRYYIDTVGNNINMMDGYYYYSANGIDSLDVALRRNESKSLPNLTLYTFILLAYAAVAGPILYYVFFKTDRRTWLWGAIPATAVVFSLLIYLIGSSTRIQKPYLKYLAEINLDSGDFENCSMNAQFTVTSPANRGFTVDLDKDMAVTPGFTDTYRDEMGGIDDYRYGVHREGDSQTLDFARVSAFSDSMFKSKRNVSLGGDLNMDIKDKKDKPSGIITNNTKYTLENCFVAYNMELYYWDEIPAGESVSVENADYYPNSYMSGNDSKKSEGDTYAYDSDYILQDVTQGIYRSFGYHDNYEAISDNRVARKMSVVTNKIYNSYETGSSSKFFCGFLKEDDDRELFPSAFDGIENYGVTAVSKIIG